MTHTLAVDGEVATHLPLVIALADWRSAHPAEAAVADIVERMAATGARVARLISGSPLHGGAERSSRTNASGDDQKQLDVLAEEIFVAALAGTGVALIGSEESEDPIRIDSDAHYVLTMDPIDGSSNIDINAPIGTIFGILPRTGFDDPAEALLQSGRAQLAAGIIIYGPSTVLILTLGDGTDIYALDPDSDAFLQTHRRITLTSDAREYAINASNARHWDVGIRAYVSDLVDGSVGPRAVDFNMRWLASLVAETYRILLRGGIFLYPADDRPSYRDGRIRLVYEANPVALLCEQAGGSATNGFDDILDLAPVALHQRTPLIFGSRNKVDRVRRYLIDPPTIAEESPLFAQRGLFRT